MLKLVLWDFDGPIFDARSPRDAAFGKLLEDLPEAGKVNFSVHGTPLYDPARLIALAFRSLGWSSEEEAEVVKRFREFLRAEEREATLQPGVRDSLEAIKRLKLDQAIVSLRSDASLSALLDQLEIRSYFSEVVNRDADLKPKPAPDGIQHILEKLEVEPSEAVMIGDSGVDLEAATAAGISYIHAGWSTEPALRGPGARPWVLSNPAELELVVRDGFRPVSDLVDPQDLRSHVTTGKFSFFTGAGVSIPSGFGGWNDTYAPILTRYLPRSVLEGLQMPDAVQLICSDDENGAGLFDAFQELFSKKLNPNSYHYTMVRSKCDTIWTTNYDDLFEKARSFIGSPDFVFRSDADLQKNFGRGRAIIKVNGDFVGATFDKGSLDWGVVVSDEQFDNSEAKRQEIWRMFEDEFRTGCLVFVGVSFTDPTLKRILSIISRKLMRPRNPHYVLSIRPQAPQDRLVVRRHVENLRRRGIQTLFFDKYDEISRFVSELCVSSRMPVVGFSGGAYLKGSDDVPEGRLEKGELNFGEIERVCRVAGRALATKGYRVVSGHGARVGSCPVAAAYETDKRTGRFYMRSKGRTAGTRSAPVVILSRDDMGPVVRALVKSSCVIVAMGGSGGPGEESGTANEVRSAIEQERPVILVPQAGGYVAACRDELMELLDEKLVEPMVKRRLLEMNEEIAKMNSHKLMRFFENDFVDWVTELVELLASSSISRVFEESCADADEKWWT